MMVCVLCKCLLRQSPGDTPVEIRRCLAERAGLQDQVVYHSEQMNEEQFCYVLNSSDGPNTKLSNYLVTVSQAQV